MTEKLQILPTQTSSDEYSEYQLSENGFGFRVFDSISNLPDWEKAQPAHNIYLQRPVLLTIEQAPPKDIKCCYLVFYKNEKPFGVSYCQLLHFKTAENVQDKEGSGVLKSISTSVKTFLAKQFEYRLLVCGNLLFTGEHCFYFDKNAVEEKTAAKLLNEALNKTLGYWKGKGVKLDGIFIKDVSEDKVVCRQEILDNKFRQFLFHPNMIMDLHPEWNTFEDYMASISSKYRVRAKKAFKCGTPIEKIEMGVEQLRANKHHLYSLYKNVMDSAKFNMVVLNENYIVRLKENLGDDFKVTGVYLDGDLIGYRTNIMNNGELEAHFLGYDQSYNYEYKLYMNMLFDSLKQAIDSQAHRLVYARTAMEIKSTIGAVPEELYCYIKANNKLMNSMMPPILEYFRPDDNWIQRNPFKNKAATS